MPNYVVNTVFKGKDQISKTFKRMSKSADMFGNTSSKAFRKASKGATSFKSITGGILGASAVTRTLGAMQQGVGGVAREFVAFDDAIFGATARFAAAEGRGADVKKIMDDLRVSARLTGATTQFTASQAAQGLDFFARAGFKSAEAIAVLRGQIDLATASGEDFASVNDWTSDLLGSFGGAALESGKKVAMMNELTASLAIAVNTANVKVEDLFETLKTAAPTAIAAGADMKELIAVTAALGSAGIKGTLGATAIKNIFVRLVKPTKESHKALASVGLQFDQFIDKTGKMMSVTKILERIGTASQKLGKAKRVALFAELFGLRAVAGAINIENNIDGITDAFKRLGNDPQAQLKELAAFMRGSLGNRLKILQSAAIELGFKFLKAFKKDGVDGITSLTRAVQNFDPKGLIEGLRTALEITKGIVKTVDTLMPLIKVLTVYFVSYKLVMGAFLALNAVHHFWLFTRALRAAVLAQGALNAAMMLNPVGFIVGAIALLITGVVLLVLNWKKVVKIFKETAEFWAPKIVGAFNMIKKAALNFYDSGIGKALLLPFIPLIEGLKLTIKLWKTIQGFNRTPVGPPTIQQKLFNLDPLNPNAPVQDDFASAGSTMEAKSQLARLIIENNSGNNVTLQGENSTAPPIWASLQEGTA